MKKNDKEGFEQTGTVMLPIDKIELNPVQPKVRHTDSAVKSLAKQIEQTNFIAPVQVMKQNGHYVMVDGERRRTVARLKGLDEIEAVVLPEGDYESSFARLNSGNRHMNGREWFAAWGYASHKKEFEECMPKGQRTDIKEIVSIWGLAETVTLAQLEQYSPNFVKQAKTLARIFRQFEIGTTGKGSISLKRMGDWMLRHNAQRLVTEWSASEPDSSQATKVYRAIQEDAPWPKMRLRRR